jgi:hypothetical protein
MDQQSLLFERMEDAIDEVIRAAGGRKAVATRLWPDKPVRDAHNLIDHCILQGRREKFDPAQVMFFLRLGREVGCHSLARYMMAEAHYSEPVPVEPEDERARLQREYIEATKVMRGIVDRLDRVQPSAPSLKSVG